jgi:esterase
MNYLSHNLIGDDGPQSKSIIFLHGIMGNKNNLKGFVKLFLAKFPGWQALIPDLRNHGQSQGFLPPHNIFTTANDVVDLVGHLEINPQVVVGHSFGGKVALLLRELLPTVEQTWMLDADPSGNQPLPLIHRDRFNAINILQTLKNISWPVKNRLELVDQLLALKVPKQIALWMTTNLVESENGGLNLVFEPNIIMEMLDSFLNNDLLPMIENNKEGSDIHIVKAENGGRISMASENKIIEISHGGNVFFHCLKNAGHFLHIDNPGGLIQIFKANLSI